MAVVSDSSPLIALGRIGRIDLLQEVFGTLIVPDAVWNEVVEAGIERIGAIEILNADWIKRQSVQDTRLVSLLRQDLGAGEAETIVLAKECGADLILMDERFGRSAAKSLGLTVVGLIGVLIHARSRGLIDNAPELMDRLCTDAGFWISPDLKKLVTGQDHGERAR